MCVRFSPESVGKAKNDFYIWMVLDGILTFVLLNVVYDMDTQASTDGWCTSYRCVHNQIRCACSTHTPTQHHWLDHLLYAVCCNFLMITTFHFLEWCLVTLPGCHTATLRTYPKHGQRPFFFAHSIASHFSFSCVLSATNIHFFPHFIAKPSPVWPVGIALLAVGCCFFFFFFQLLLRC